MAAGWEAVRQLLEGGFSQVRVVVVGDVVLDRYVLGDLAGETPVPVLRCPRQFARPGDAANVAMSVAGLGCEAFLCGYWGADGAQAELASLLEAGKVETTGVVSSPLATASRTRMMAGERELLRLESGSSEAQPAEEQVRLEARAVELVKKVHVVVLADYRGGSGGGSGGGTLSAELCSAVIRAARAAGLPVMALAATEDLSAYSGATMVLSRSDEPASAAGQMAEHDLGLLAFAAPGKGLVLLSADGERYGTAQGQDVSAAGDCMLAVLATALAAGVERATAVELTAATARTVLGKVGTAPVSRQELLAVLQAEGWNGS